MKLKSSYLFLICLGVLLASCTRISFLHPAIVKKQDLVFKKELLGQWMEKTDTNGILITIDTALSYDSSLIYKISLIGKSDSNYGDSSYLEGKLINIKDKLFMMIYSDLEHTKMREIGLYNAVMILPSCYFIRMFSISNDSLSTGQFNGDTLIGLIKNRKITIKHQMIEEDDYLILEKGEGLANKLNELDKFKNIYEKTTYRRIK